MIQEIKRITPFIHFGFNRTEVTVQGGESIQLWLQTLYNLEFYFMNLTAAVPKVKRSNYQWTLTPVVAGTYEIYMTVATKNPGKTVEVESNTIILTVT